MGEDYEYVFGTYRQQLMEELELLNRQKELEDEHERKYGLLGERNMAILNTALSGRKMLEGFRDSYVNRMITDQGGIGNAGVTFNKETNQWEDASGEAATWVSRDKIEEMGFWDNAKKDLLGWHSGIVKLEDGQHPTPVSKQTSSDKNTESAESKEEEETEDIS